jgi:hypothetical protein
MEIILIILTFSVPIVACKCPVFWYWYMGKKVEKHSCKMSFEEIM